MVYTKKNTTGSRVERPSYFGPDNRLDDGEPKAGAAASAPRLVARMYRVFAGKRDDSSLLLIDLI